MRLHSQLQQQVTSVAFNRALEEYRTVADNLMNKSSSNDVCNNSQSSASDVKEIRD